MQVGEWRITKEIGEGAFGRTFLGEHVHLKGLKGCIKQEKTGQHPYMDLFREEAAVLAKLRHPSLPTFMGYTEMPMPIGQVLILSFVEGVSLEAKIGKVADEHICWIIDRLLGALSYLHGRWQIVHCDIKPANVILDIEDHNATLVDLGMASLRPCEFTKAKGGTPGYLPPEFNMGLPPIPASDIYSVGKIACALAGGDPITGVFPKSMDARLSAFFEPWTRHDPRQRPQAADPLRVALSELRHKIWGRTSTAKQWEER